MVKIWDQFWRGQRTKRKDFPSQINHNLTRIFSPLDVQRAKTLASKIRRKHGSTTQGRKKGFLFSPAQSKKKWFGLQGGERLGSFLAQWQSITNNFILDLIALEYRVEFNGRPPGRLLVTSLPKIKTKASAMTSQLQGVLNQRVISPIPPGQEMGDFYS